MKIYNDISVLISPWSNFIFKLIFYYILLHN